MLQAGLECLKKQRVLCPGGISAWRCELSCQTLSSKRAPNHQRYPSICNHLHIAMYAAVIKQRQEHTVVDNWADAGVAEWADPDHFQHVICLHGGSFYSSCYLSGVTTPVLHWGGVSDRACEHIPCHRQRLTETCTALYLSHGLLLPSEVYPRQGRR